jgi:hypothetical protein
MDVDIVEAGVGTGRQALMTVSADDIKTHSGVVTWCIVFHLVAMSLNRRL